MSDDEQNRELAKFIRSELDKVLELPVNKELLYGNPGEQRFVIGNDGADDSRRDERRYLDAERWKPGRRCSQIRKGRYGIHEECETPSQREEFEHQFGVITDDQWQWLKEFIVRNTGKA